MARFIGIFILLLPLTLLAQRYKTLELKPISKQGWQYYYDLKRVSSPVALEVPLMALNDEEVTRYYRASKSFRIASGIVAGAPLIYLLTLPSNGYVDPTVFLYVLGGTFVTQIGLEAIRHIKLGKAINRYNSLIFQPSSSSLGLKITWKFL
jgi:hypothetical protein